MNRLQKLAEEYAAKFDDVYFIKIDRNAHPHKAGFRDGDGRVFWLTAHQLAHRDVVCGIEIEC